jgi:hypothetical protein
MVEILRNAHNERPLSKARELNRAAVQRSDSIMLSGVAAANSLPNYALGCNNSNVPS